MSNQERWIVDDVNRFQLDSKPANEPKYWKDGSPIDTEKIEYPTRKQKLDKYSSSVKRTTKKLDSEFMSFRRHLRQEMYLYMEVLSHQERQDVTKALLEMYPSEIRQLWKTVMKDFEKRNV